MGQGTQEREDDLARLVFQVHQAHEDLQQTPSAVNTLPACCHLFEKNSPKSIVAAAVMMDSQWDISNLNTTVRSKTTPTPRLPSPCLTYSMYLISKQKARRNLMVASTSLLSHAVTYRCASLNPRTVTTG